MSLLLQPITLREANAFVAEHHRHHPPARGCVCCVAVNDGERVRRADETRPRVGKAAAARTPEAFRAVLIGMARSVHAEAAE